MKNETGYFEGRELKKLFYQYRFSIHNSDIVIATYEGLDLLIRGGQINFNEIGCIVIDESGNPQMPEREIKDEWFMCWECHRCLAYCPTGALYICGKDPTNSYPIEAAATGEQLDALITNRRSCRNYLQENVDKELINHILKIVVHLDIH